MKIDLILDNLIRREGGFVNDPDDPGGMTKYGITARTFRTYYGHWPTEEEMRNLSKDQAKEIYRRAFVTEPGFDQVQFPRVRRLLVDCGVQHGPEEGIEWLQAAVGAKVDGIIGPDTLRRLEKVATYENGPEEILCRILTSRLKKYHRQSKNPKRLKFLRGWLKRTIEFMEKI